MASSFFARSTARASYRALVFALAYCVTGCGGEDKGRVSGATPIVAPIDQCKLAEEYYYQNLVDFEPRNGDRAALCDPEIAKFCNMPNPTSSPFYFNHDGCPDDSLFDSNINQSDVPGALIPEGARCGVSESALHIKATHVSDCYKPNGRLGWGAGLDLTMVAQGLDAKALPGGPYEGISFWVRRGAGYTKPSLIFSVVDTANTSTEHEFSSTDPDSELPCGCVHLPTDADPDNVKCYSDPPATVPDGRKCDAFSAAVTLSDDWTFVAVPFASLKQKGFGAAALLPEVDVTQIRRLQFLMTSGDWNFWIDDIKLFKAKP